MLQGWHRTRFSSVRGLNGSMLRVLRVERILLDFHEKDHHLLLLEVQQWRAEKKNAPEMEVFLPAPRHGGGRSTTGRTHMQGIVSSAGTRARWAQLEPENLQHVQTSRRIDREQQARQQSDQTPRVKLLGSGVQQQHSSKLIG